MHQNVLGCHFDIDVLRINARRRELEPKHIILLDEFDCRFPHQLSFSLHPIVDVSAEKAAVQRENVVSTPHDAVVHPFDFIENGLALSNWN
jgi:hypothetical protein